MLDPAHLAPESARALRREEYERMVQPGTFDGDLSISVGDVLG
ncbi:MAG: hypothetical protein RLP09_21960 [Sandaracinaceae bacterium]